MSSQKSSIKIAAVSILSAIAASLCCITPVLALIAGSTGMASSFSWLEPYRPYFILLTVGVLGFAWYQKFKPKKADITCNCSKDEKTPFIQSTTFLGIVTVFAITMTLFPYFSGVFYPKNEVGATPVHEEDVFRVTFDIKGMTCEGCNHHIEHAVMQLPGSINAKADYKTGTANVQFDKTKNTLEDVKAAIDETGYSVIAIHTQN